MGRVRARLRAGGAGDRAGRGSADAAAAVPRGRAPRRAVRGDAADPGGVPRRAVHVLAVRAGEAMPLPCRACPAPLRERVPLVATRSDAIALGAEGANVNTHLVAQWAMERQLANLGRGPVSLYLDLPVGVSCDAYEVWRHPYLFLTDLSAGAPPDPLFLG